MSFRFLAVAALWPAIGLGQVTIGPDGPVAPQRRPTNDQPRRIRLTVTPAAEPVPPLKFRFDVPMAEKKPGNSVPFYYRAIAFLNQGENRKAIIDAYHDMEEPLTDERKEEIRRIVSGNAAIFEELERATVREETDWSWRLQELNGLESISFRLEEIQDSRDLARLLHLKVRLEIAEERYGDAEKTLRTGYALARAVAAEPIIINDLVGVAIESILNLAVQDWIGKPGSPNVYWALASLPDPPIDFRPAFEYELAMPYRFAPWLKDAETDPAPPDVWRDRLAQLLSEVMAFQGDLFPIAPDSDQAGPGLKATAFLTALALRAYPDAKRRLIERGFDPERVEAMPVGQVIAIQQKFADDVIAQEMMKGALVAPDVADDVLARAEKLIQPGHFFGRLPVTQAKEPLPLMTTLAPATRQAIRAELRLRAYLAGLRAIEAIRMHAAATGSLPQSLDAIEVVPVPDNPATGEPFGYALNDGTAVLEVNVSDTIPIYNRRFELTLAK